jgi:tRNA G46 methylase TrmB
MLIILKKIILNIFSQQKINLFQKIAHAITNKFDRREWLYNKIYFYCFVYFHNIEFFFDVDKQQLKKNHNKIIKDYSNEVHHAPLLRTKKLLNYVKKSNDYHFIDIGSGLGILLFFVSMKYSFKTYQGIELNKYIYHKSIKNLKKLNLKKEVLIKNISADKFKLDPNKKYIIYFFNPFKNFILEKFLRNNIKVIRNNKSIILYHNDKTENIFKKYNFNQIKIDLGLNVYLNKN